MRHLAQRFLSFFLLVSSVSVYSQGQKPIVWRLDSTLKIGGITPIVVGDPKQVYYLNGDAPDVKVEVLRYENL